MLDSATREKRGCYDLTLLAVKPGRLAAALTLSAGDVFFQNELLSLRAPSIRIAISFNQPLALKPYLINTAESAPVKNIVDTFEVVPQPY